VYAEHNTGKRNVEHSMNAITSKLLVLSVVIVIFSIFGSERFVVAVSSEKYRFVAMYLPYTLSAYFVFTIAMLASTELYAKGKVTSLILPNAISGILGIASLFLFVSSHGFAGGVIGYTVTYSSYAVTILLLLKYYRKGTRVSAN
jgi:O-antigen/teichoic acid export membrane protein